MITEELSNEKYKTPDYIRRARRNYERKRYYEDQEFRRKKIEVSNENKKKNIEKTREYKRNYMREYRAKKKAEKQQTTLLIEDIEKLKITEPPSEKP